MRIPFPERFSVWAAFCFATVLCTAQLLQGTDPVFSLCCFSFIMVATLTFNLAGGLTRPSGAYVFFYAVLAVILGLCWKVILGEPADSNLSVPLLTMRVFLGGICAMFAAVYISRKLTTKRAILGSLVTEANMRNATLGCMLTGSILTVLFFAAPVQNGSILSAIGQLNRFLQMAIILGVIHEIRKSGGTRSINAPVLISGAIIFANGLIGFSKEGMFTPLICWLVAAGSQRYKVTVYQILGGSLAVVFMLYFMVPYSQYGRNFKSQTGSVSENFNTSLLFLSQLDTVRQEDKASQANAYEDRILGYYNTPQGLIDRLQMVSVDDSLIAVTERGQVFGLSPVIMGFENYVPHIFWPDKPGILFGNTFAHETGVLTEDDESTGVSFSPSGEGFHLARWYGVLLVAPLLWIMLFTVFDSLCGDVYHSPWGLLMIAFFSHAAPEGMLDSVIYMLWFSSLMVVFIAVTTGYVMPILGTFIAGPEPISVVRGRPIRSIPRRQLPVTPSNGQ